MNLDTIDLGFIRPRDQLEWNMAYAQSQIYVNYLKDQYGPRRLAPCWTLTAMA